MESTSCFVRDGPDVRSNSEKTDTGGGEGDKPLLFVAQRYGGHNAWLYKNICSAHLVPKRSTISTLSDATASK